MIKIDKNGDSEGNFTVLAFKYDPHFDEKAKYNFSCNYGMRPVAGFQFANEKLVNNRRSLAVYDVSKVVTTVALFSRR